MSIKQYEIWIADLNPQIGTEAGKTRPVLIIQTNLLNQNHNGTHKVHIAERVLCGNQRRILASPGQPLKCLSCMR